MSDRMQPSASPASWQDSVENKAESMTDTARAQASDAADSVKQAAGKAAEDIKAQGAELLGQAQGRAEELVDEGKAAGAEHASDFARAIHHAADDLEDSSPDIARHVRAAGDSLNGIAQALREKSAGQLLSDVTDFARRQPALFFGAAAIAGFSLVRFARSSAERSQPAPSRHARTAGSDWDDASTSEAPPPTTMSRATLGGAAAYSHGRADTAHMPTPPVAPATTSPSGMGAGQGSPFANTKSDFAP